MKEGLLVLKDAAEKKLESGRQLHTGVLRRDVFKAQ